MARVDVDSIELTLCSSTDGAVFDTIYRRDPPGYRSHEARKFAVSASGRGEHGQTRIELPNPGPSQFRSSRGDGKPADTSPSHPGAFIFHAVNHVRRHSVWWGLHFRFITADRHQFRCAETMSQ